MLVSELRLTAGCVLMDLASPAISGTSVYANGLKNTGIINSTTRLHLVGSFYEFYFLFVNFMMMLLASDVSSESGCDLQNAGPHRGPILMVSQAH